MKISVLLITPPFTQLNTPYPATAYLKGFLNSKNISGAQIDLGIDTLNAIFCKTGLCEMFDHLENSAKDLSPNTQRMLTLRRDYQATIDSVMAFLKGHNASHANTICQDGFLPEASRFSQLQDLDWAFGTLGIQDRAKHIATLYLEDLADLITENIDPHFGFSRYAERLARSASSFDKLYSAIQRKHSIIEQILISLLQKSIDAHQPSMVAISIPFPGNLFSALRCGQWLKLHHPQCKVIFGGGYVNTELRSLTDKRVFEFCDYLTLDDGEAPLEHLIEYHNGTRKQTELKRTFCLLDNKVTYINGSTHKDYPLSEIGTPDYSDLPLNYYISIIETVNPMHRLWSDGRWNKLTMAHGCYWGKCTFCDTSLNYIKDYQPVQAKLICDRMEQLIAQTGENGFHFVDEAAPPALMRDVAIEILRRKLSVSWWTNIRFEKRFSRELCLLLKESGCIAVSGGLEVASDRLLQLIQKGVTVSQVAKVCQNFTDAGIMVHAYLMYGFPTQTAQETIDSLEMVRQLFETGILQSGFWHQFAMTAHSPVGLKPDTFHVKPLQALKNPFANNDIIHQDPKGADHGQFSYGLKKSLFNYMHGIHFDFPLQEWFDFKVPRTTVKPRYIENILTENQEPIFQKPDNKIIWLGNSPIIREKVINKKHHQIVQHELIFHHKTATLDMLVSAQQSEWINTILVLLSIQSEQTMTFQAVKQHYEESGLENFESFWYNEPFCDLRELGLMVLP